MEFKVGDKVKIPKTKSIWGEYSSFKSAIQDYKKDYLILKKIENKGKDFVLKRDDSGHLSWDTFALQDLELYEEEFPKKWVIKVNTKEEFDLVCGTLNKQKNEAIYLKPGYRFEGGSRFVSKEDDFRGYTYERSNIWNDRTLITLEQFKKHILKESTIMKNLLETEFVIENCTLSQRLAIKAYCDEKKIKYFEDCFEDMYFPHIGYYEGCDRVTEFIECNSVEHTKITFSELIQFLDQYQPEVEFKVGDFVFVTEGYPSLNGKKGEIYEIIKIQNNLFFYRPFESIDQNKIKFRHATLEEIKKWKEENEIKLPTIDGHKGRMTAYVGPNDTLSWGCTSISVRTVKEFLKLDLAQINFNNGINLDYNQIKQIKKFIEHNKL